MFRDMGISSVVKVSSGTEAPPRKATAEEIRAYRERMGKSVVGMFVGGALEVWALVQYVVDKSPWQGVDLGFRVDPTLLAMGGAAGILLAGFQAFRIERRERLRPFQLFGTAESCEHDTFRVENNSYTYNLYTIRGVTITNPDLGPATATVYLRLPWKSAPPGVHFQMDQNIEQIDGAPKSGNPDVRGPLNMQGRTTIQGDMRFAFREHEGMETGTLDFRRAILVIKDPNPESGAEVLIPMRFH